MSDYDLSQFPEGSLLSQLVMDLYAYEGAVTILYDRPFIRVLEQIEYKKDTRELFFLFREGRVAYGKKLSKDIDPIIRDLKTVTMIEVDEEGDEAVMGMEVPLIVF